MANTKISALTSATTPLAGTEVLPIVQAGSTVKVAVTDLTAGRAVSVSSLTNTGLTASKPVFTDASKVLTSTGVVPVANGGTNASAASITAFNNITGYTAAGATGTTSTNLVFSTSPSITTPTLVGDVTVSTGNVIIGTSGKGIDFSATPGTGTSELLADYEEGTYTPTFTPNTSGTLVLNSADSRNKFVYTKTGRSVAITGYVQFLGSSTPVGTSVTISLPFAACDGGGTIGGAGIVAVFNGVTYLFNLNAGASTMTWTIAASSITDGLFLTLSFNYTAT